MFKRFLLAVSLLILRATLISQVPVTCLLKGQVKDAANKAILGGATISFYNTIKRTIVTSSTGNYFLVLPAGDYQVKVSMMGYQTDSVLLSLRQNQKMDFYLKSRNKELDTVVVATQRRFDNLKRDLIGVQKISVSEFKNLPVLFGEKDIFKSIQLLPGIKSAGEGNSGFFVRGGSSDQNLILLDGATINNASHLLGFFSIFNSDIIKNLSIYKGSVPAEFGGRLSSVIDVNTQDEGMQKLTVKGGLGLIISRLSIQAPIVKNKLSIMVSARKAYPDTYLPLAPTEKIKNNLLHFSDYNAKIQIKPNQKNEISLMGYKGRDVFSVNRTFGIDYGNDLVSLKWKHSKNEHHFSNTVFSYSNYSYDINIRNSNSNLLILAAIKNASVRYENQTIKNENHQFKVGFDVVLHEIKPSSIIANDGSSFNTVDMEVRRNFEANAFISNHWKINDKLVLDYGLRVNSFSILGPGNYINYDSFGNPTKFFSYKLYQISVPYITPEPRFSANYELSKYKYLKFSYTRNAQNIHQVSNSTSASPTDLFMSSNNNLKPEIADQISAGYFSNVNESMYEFSAELYYKYLQNQLDFRNGSQLIANQQFEKQLVFGIGRAYGLEMLFKKKNGKLNGWIGYTLSRTERKFSVINNNQWFKARQDRLHEISIVGMYQLSKRLVFSSVWVYYSGCPVTLPVGVYNISGQNIYYYTERNGSKMPDYHRLDLSLTLDGKKRKKYEDSWTFSIFNAYNRENAYSIDFQSHMSSSGKFIVTQTTLFKLVPSIIYNFKF